MSTYKSNTLMKICLLLGCSLLVMGNAAIGPSLTQINQVFNDPFYVSLLMTLPAIGVVLSAPFVDKLMRLVGEKNALLVGLFIYGAAGSSGLWLNSIYALLYFRLLFGVGIAICMTVINHIIGSAFQGKSRTDFISFQSIAVNLGGVVFVLLSGSLAEYNWRFPFSLYLLSFVILIMSAKAITIPTHRDDEIKKRLTGSDIKRVFPSYVMGLIGMLFYYMILINLPFTLVSSLSLTSRMIGIVMAGMSVLSVIVAYLFRHMLSTLGERWLLVICFSCYAIALTLLALTQFEWRAYVTIVFSGIGFGLLLPTLSHMIMSLSTAVLRARLMSGFVMSYFLGQALSAFVLQLNMLLPEGLVFLIFAMIAAITACLCARFLDIKEPKEEALKVRENDVCFGKNFS
ncbi:MFS transporter [Moritella viscosa]|uniref:MFS transporter n=2 Tax=Moritella viscosa TaxID=80854 RepID=UPI0009131E2B|nr:MFS transporter [Moritella viscosa]SHO00664.1 Permease MFS family [Moritella viscosa]SHO00981.1 Permease MFS family [Moritella viscosa]SHO02398.1 Permease MFS family [Moritella viscosa]SHO04306.1 Permease MFS family [Moritella viscosa]